jgi:hypothetical protein
MTLFRSARAHVVVLAIALGGCGERVEAGLANAPSIERKTEPRNQYDVISNGDEGCKNRNGGPGIASAAGACPKHGSQVVADAGPEPSSR